NTSAFSSSITVTTLSITTPSPIYSPTPSPRITPSPIYTPSPSGSPSPTPTVTPQESPVDETPTPSPEPTQRPMSFIPQASTVSPHKKNDEGSQPSNSVIIRNKSQYLLKVYKNGLPWEIPVANAGTIYSTDLSVEPNESARVTRASSNRTERITLTLEAVQI